MSEKNIFQRINAVMQEVAYVQKDKAVTGMGAGYKAVTHDNLVSVPAPHSSSMALSCTRSRFPANCLRHR